MIYKFLNHSPQFDESVFIAPGADLIGEITIGKNSSIWFNTTIRGDVNRIEIGNRTNVQDNSCIHVMNKTGPAFIGSEVTVGHNAMVHGCTIHDRVIIGIQATVLDKAVVEPEVIVAAGSLVPPGKTLESGHMYMGSPVRQVRKLTPEEIDLIKQHADNYVKYSRTYKQLDINDPKPFFTPRS